MSALVDKSVEDKNKLEVIGRQWKRQGEMEASAVQNAGRSSCYASHLALILLDEPLEPVRHWMVR